MTRATLGRRKVLVTLPPDLLSAVDAAARGLCSTRSAAIEAALREWLAATQAVDAPPARSEVDRYVAMSRSRIPSYDHDESARGEWGDWIGHGTYATRQAAHNALARARGVGCETRIVDRRATPPTA